MILPVDMDVVITYVDINDKFRQDFSKYVKQDLNEKRFRSYGVLDLQIKMIRKYMSYVNNIFVIVSDESQVPENLDLNSCKIVYHKDIIPEKYLPCFNSCTIEMFMYRIPGLDEEFIYFNDDIFVINYINKEYFFKDSKPCLQFEIKDYSYNETEIYKTNLFNSTKEISKLLRSEKKFDSKYIKMAHSCRPFLKSTCEKVFNKLNFKLISSLTRTRHSKNFNATIFNDYDYMSLNYVNQYPNYTYIESCGLIDKIIDTVNKKETPIICINDNDDYIDFDKFKENLNGLFNANLEKKEYVKPIKTVKEEIITLDNTPLKVALCAIAKNENLYIREWVEWYKNLGISKIFLYDNNELDGEKFEDVINDYIEIGFVEIIDVRGVEKGCVYDEEGINLQPKCYIDCYKNKCNNFDWVCFFDIDEFLKFKNGYNLFGFLNQKMFNDTDTILVSWEHYDDNNLIYYDSRPVVERFTHLSKKIFTGCKSICKTNKEINDKKQPNLIHCFTLKNRNIKFSTGKELNIEKEDGWYILDISSHLMAPVVLNHYKTKTICEFLRRQVGRHWGTGKKHTKYAKTLNNCLYDFFLYNEKSDEKENIGKNYLINNGKKYNNEIGIISLTSWKGRINTVNKTIENLLKICNNFHIVLVLSEEEFKNKYNDLPLELINNIIQENIEILWVDKNYKAFKKILFTMNKYQNLPIISADDDLIYKENYAQKLYDIWINNKEYSHITSHHNKMLCGCGACSLYAPNCFKEAYKLLNDDVISTNEDDMFYQYLIDNLQLKQYFIDNYWPWKQHTSENALSTIYKNEGRTTLERKEKYYNIYDKLNLSILNINYNELPIISFTSYKDRLKYCSTVIKSILQNTIQPYKIVLTLYKDDAKLIVKNSMLDKYISSGKVELLICDIDIRSHKKYFYTMQKYRNHPIITIDDDVFYTPDLIESLMNSYKKYPNCVHGRRVHKKTYNDDGTLKEYKKWIFENQDILEPSTEIMCIGVGGVLYPPDILHINNDNLKDIYKYITVDDVYLHYLELKNHIKIVYCKNNKNHPDLLEGSQKTALWLTDNNFKGENNTDKAIKELLNYNYE